MFAVAICDDDQEDLRDTGILLKNYAAERPDMEMELTAFSTGRELLHSDNYAGFDLYLLDVLMPELNGIAAGLQLRERGAEGAIVYLTTSRDYAVESYQARAFYYLLKPLDRAKLFPVLDRVFELKNRRESECMMLATRYGVRQIPLDDILYAERTGRVMRCYCVGQTLDSLSLRGSFREMAEPLLADSRFCQCGASFVLNYRHISAVEGDTAVMDDGTRLPLPRRYSNQVKRGWINYWMERGKR